MSDGILFLRVAADRIGAPGPDRIVGKMPFRATNAATWSPIIRIGAKMVVIRRRMHVERFRVTLNGPGAFHMGNFG